jgi:hypothetical protein
LNAGARVEIWSLLAPTSGTSNVTITLNNIGLMIQGGSWCVLCARPCHGKRECMHFHGLSQRLNTGNLSNTGPNDE